jgi:hypothetical protein
LSGVLAAGLVALLIALTVAWYLSSRTDMPGPGTATLVWHAVAVVVAIPVQIYADRTAGPRGTMAALVVIVTTAALLTLQWLL